MDSGAQGKERGVDGEAAPAKTRNVPQSCCVSHGPMPARFLTLWFAGLGFLWMIGEGGAASSITARQHEYQRNVLPVLRQFCFDCHGGGVSKGKLAFDTYESFEGLLGDKAAWKKATQLLQSHVMPPVEKPQPTTAQRRLLLDWIDRTVFYVDPQRPDPGHVTLRRLNRAEYNNSVRDIFRIEASPADQFPPDDSGYGFDNVADALTLSPLLMEKYFRAASQVLDEALRLETTARVGIERDDARLTVFAGQPDVSTNSGVTLLKSAADEIGVELKVPVAARYRVLTRAAASKHGESLARLAVLLDGRPVAELEPKAEWKGRKLGMPGVFALVELPAGRHRVSLRLAGAGVPDRVAAVDFLALTGPFSPGHPVPSEFLQTLLPGRKLGVPTLRLSGEDTEGGEGRNSLDTGKAWFATRGYRRLPLFLPAGGQYRFRVKAGAQQVGGDPVRFEVRLGARSLGEFTVTAGSAVAQDFVFERELSAGQDELQVWFVNEFKDAQSGAERWLWLHELSIEGPLKADLGLRAEEVPALLEQTGRRLFRRPLLAEEKAKLTKLARAAEVAGEDVFGTLRLGLESLLVSPKFLFHNQPRPAGPERNGSVPIDEFTLAARLASFLWSSAPDEELLALAERGQLRKQLPAQVKRLLADARARAFTENFAGQWLQLRDLGHVAPDAQRFPGFTPELAAGLRRETELLFEHILRGNRPALEFLTADYTFANAHVAQHYGLPAPAGDGFARVSLAGTPRGGLLTHAGVLTLTSHPTRTSPVKRGKWLLEQILGTPPPPAPNNVPPLKETEKEDEREPLRKRLEAHRANAACAACHAFLDPMGFAFEHYDAVGRWRERDGAHAVDAAGQLVSGQRFRDAAELRKILARDFAPTFLNNLAEQLLTYALGRGVTYQDKTAVREITGRASAGNLGFQTMVLATCESVPFQRMRPPVAESNPSKP